MKRLKILGLAGVVLLAAGGAFYFLTHEREPEYRGWTVTEWLTKLVSHSSGRDAHRLVGTGRVKLNLGVGRDQSVLGGHDSVMALQAIGTNALPVLLKMVGKTDGKLKSRVINFVNGQNLIKVRIGTAADIRQRGETGFAILGTEAKPAIPELLKLAESPEAVVRGSALYCLSVTQTTNEKFLAVLQRRFQDTNYGIRLEAALLLSESFTDEAGRLGVFARYPFLRDTNWEASSTTVIITSKITDQK